MCMDISKAENVPQITLTKAIYAVIACKCQYRQYSDMYNNITFHNLYIHFKCSHNVYCSISHF